MKPMHGNSPACLPRCPRYKSLDLWRGIACLLVVMYHATIIECVTGRKQVPEGWLPNATRAILDVTHYMWIGVPMFFVISGYCISATADSLRRRPLAVRTYFYRRVRRIYPPYWAALLLLVPFVLAVDYCLFPNRLLFREPWAQLPPWWRTGWQWLGSITLTETWRHYFVGGHQGQVLGPAWTLCYEEQFYLVFGLLIFVAPRRPFLAAAILTVLVVVAQFACRWLEIPVDGFFFDGKWHLFAAGILVYYTINYATAVQYWWLFGLLAVCAIWCWSGYGVSYEGEAGFTLALAILLLHRWDARVASVRMLMPLTFCGTLCYSLYLVHEPLVRAIARGLHLAGIVGDGPTLLLTVPCCLALSLPTAWLFHRFIERRFLNTNRKQVML